MAYLRKAKGQKRNIEEKLAELEVKPSKRTKLTSQCSKLCEGNNGVEAAVTPMGILAPVALCLWLCIIKLSSYFSLTTGLNVT